MDSVKDAMGTVELDGDDFNHPIPYTFMYVQWEANKVLHIRLLNVSSI